MNYVGLVAAASAFLSIWFGHVAVRKAEASTERLWIPAMVFIAAGLLLEWAALITTSLAESTACGIVGITFLWDALELHRQEQRVRTGRAPANPLNPRHAAMLAEPDSTATTIDLLKRERGVDSPDAPAQQNGERRQVGY